MIVASTFRETRTDRWTRRVFGDMDGQGVISPRSPLVVVRVALILLILIVVQFDEVERPTLVVALLVAAIMVQPLVPDASRPADQILRRFGVTDLAFSTAIALAAGTVATNHVLVAVGLMGIAATCHRSGGFVIYAACAICSVALVLVVSGDDRPGQTVIASAIVGLGFGGFTLRYRLAAETARRDRELAIDVAGGIFTTGVVGDPVVTCVGDVEALLGWVDREDGRLDVRTAVHPEDFDDYWIPVADLTPGAEIVRTARFRVRDGGWKWIREVTRVVERNGVLEVRGLLLDHTDDLDDLMRVKAEATTDSLTGLANRRVLDNLLDRSNVPGRHVVLLDLDSFKRVNDTLGHEAGDELLRIVAQRVGSTIRSSDLLARLGGDEFAIVFEQDLAPAEVHDLVARVLDVIKQPMHVNGVVLDTSASAGVVREDEIDRRGAAALLRCADVAMYEAKLNGWGSTRFVQGMEQRHGRNAVLVRDLPAALTGGDLRLFFQPIVDVSGRRVVAAEGLARWVHPDLGVLSPAAFLDVVLVSAQAGAFTRAMVGHALDISRSLAEAGHHLAIAVNLPMSTLEDPVFARWFFDECAASSVDPAGIVFETSEQELHSDDRTVAAIREFTRRGVNLSIDDFGTGHATFERLRWHGVGQLKIDHRMVGGAASNGRDAVILRNVVTMAKELGYEIVGEGVETDSQRMMLEEFGVDLLQGFLFAGALDRDDFLAYAERSRARSDADLDNVAW